MNGSRGFAMKLLIKDGFEQRFKGGRRGIESQGESTDAVNERSQFWVAGLQMGYGFNGIEGKFSAFAVVDHRRTVYRDGARMRLTARGLGRKARSAHRALVPFRTGMKQEHETP